jgi:hypothetical protein
VMLMVGDTVEVVVELDEEEGSPTSLRLRLAPCLPEIAPTWRTTQFTRNDFSLLRRRLELDPTP